jgi:hypothetical protein
MSTDERIISEAVVAHVTGHEITDLQARVIASAWHDGQGSDLYRLTSTGAITGDLIDELTNQPGMDADELLALRDYVQTYGPRGPQPAWSKLSW